MAILWTLDLSRVRRKRFALGRTSRRENGLENGPHFGLWRTHHAHLHLLLAVFVSAYNIAADANKSVRSWAHSAEHQPQIRPRDTISTEIEWLSSDEGQPRSSTSGLDAHHRS